MGESYPPRADLVRCLECGRTYVLPVRTEPGDGIHGCTDCGAASWIALSIPTRERSGPTPGVRRTSKP